MQRLLLAAALAAAPACAFAHDGPRATDHAPIGVMADHTHNKGEWMLGYRYMRSEMGGMRLDGDAISPEQVAVIANPYAPPATLRTVPLSGAMDMHMFGVMWAPSDRLTLMASGNYAERNMRSVVFAGPAGTTRLAETTGSSNGFGDIRLSTLWDLRSSDTSRLVLAVGATVPTGSIDKTARMLTPMNTTMEMVMPYGMQMGSGTVDPFASLTWAAEAGRVSWGAQGRATLRLYDNDRDYRLGDEAAVTAWAGYSPAPSLSLTVRAEARAWGDISGRDVRIAGASPSANPANYGGEQVSLFAGANYAFQGAMAGHRLGVEVGAPVYSRKNGLQSETDLMAAIGWQYAF